VASLEKVSVAGQGVVEQPGQVGPEFVAIGADLQIDAAPVEVM
jgi:hypothetical protein